MPTLLTWENHPWTPGDSDSDSGLVLEFRSRGGAVLTPNQSPLRVPDRLRLLARCYNSGRIRIRFRFRLRLRLRLRLRTPAKKLESMKRHVYLLCSVAKCTCPLSVIVTRVARLFRLGGKCHYPKKHLPQNVGIYSPNFGQLFLKKKDFKIFL